MGNAKRSGTYEQRKAKAIERERVKQEKLSVVHQDIYQRRGKLQLSRQQAVALIVALGGTITEIK